MGLATTSQSTARETPDRGVDAASTDAYELISLSRLRDRWKLLLIAALVGAGIGLVAAFALPKEYEASALLMLVAPTPAEGPPPSPTSFRVLAETNGIVERVVSEYSLGNAPFHLTPQRFLDEALSVDEVRGTNLVRVRVRLRDPNVAAQVSNAVAEHAAALQQSISGSDRDAIAARQKTRLEAEQRLEALEKEFADFRRAAQVGLAREDADARLALRATLLLLLVEIETEKARLSQDGARRALTDKPTVRVIDRARPPDGPLWPKPALFAAIGVFLGVALPTVILLSGVRAHRRN